jgi:hypothetical protein
MNALLWREAGDDILGVGPARHDLWADKIRDRDQAFDDVEALCGADVEAKALLVDVGVVEIARSVEIDLELLGGRGAGQPATLILRPFDLDDLRAESAQPAGRPRPRPHPAEIDDADTRQGLHS